MNGLFSFQPITFSDTKHAPLCMMLITLASVFNINIYFDNRGSFISPNFWFNRERPFTAS